MLRRDSGVLVFLLLSLIFSILTLTAGYKRGMLDNVAIATHQYEKSSTPFAPSESYAHLSYNATPLLTDYEGSILAIFFKIHYLSLCAGWAGLPKADHAYNHAECIPKPLGWTFRPDDPFITNYGSNNGKSPVVMKGIELEELQTKGPAATLVLGLILTILAITTFAVELLGHGIWNDLNIAKVSTVLMALAASSLMVSSALITHTIINRKKYAGFNEGQFSGWTTKFLGLSWIAVVLMYVTIVWKAWNDVWQKENRIRQLRSSLV